MLITLFEHAHMTGLRLAAWEKTTKEAKKSLEVRMDPCIYVYRFM
jgi:hypothetical protein